MRARAFVAFGAYLCLATHLVGVLHVLVVRHATCPSHGEIVHGAAAHVKAAAPASLDSAPGLRAAAAESSEEDEHCLFVATRRREMAGLARGQAVAARIAPASTIEAPPSIVVATARTIFRLAPKTSPPIAAV